MDCRDSTSETLRTPRGQPSQQVLRMLAQISGLTSCSFTSSVMLVLYDSTSTALISHYQHGAEELVMKRRRSQTQICGLEECEAQEAPQKKNSTV